MHLFRSVFLLGVAAIAFVEMEAPQASAFLLPMTRYMLDAIPDGAETPEGDFATGSDDGAPVNVAESIANADVPVAVDTPAVVPADDQGEAEDSSAGSSLVPPSPPNTSAEPVDVSNATSAIPIPESSSSPDHAASPSSVSPVVPSASVSDNILAQANAANHVVGLGGSSVLVGSVLATILFAL